MDYSDIKIGFEEREFDPISLKGIPSSAGIAIGTARVLEPESIVSPQERIPRDKIESEINRFDIALSELIREFSDVLEKVRGESKNIVAIIETNLMIATDPTFTDSVTTRIKEGYSVESSIIYEFDRQKQFFKKSRDQILRERAGELDHIKERLLGTLRNRCLYYGLARNSIIVAQSLTPSDLVNLKESSVLAIVTELGGIASHMSILARSFEIPAVIGVKKATQFIKDGAKIIVDGYSGTVLNNPDQEAIAEYEQRREQAIQNRKKLGTLANVTTQTSDKREIKAMANVDFLEDVNLALVAGADGIGLVRSENLLLSLEHFPDEEEQYQWYKEIAERMYPSPVTIRVFDLGSDKYSKGMPRHEDNPALGFRGIRFLLSRLDVFEVQIRAILRASVDKNVRIMIPMITNLSEVIRAFNIIEKCKHDLSIEGIDHDERMPFGVMIETPAAAILAEEIAKFCNFFSIGTNDLTQYTLASDRTNELVSDVFDSFHPAVLKLMKMTVDAAHRQGIDVGICGEIAGHSAATQLIIGLGIDEISVSPTILLETKKRILDSNFEDSVRFSEDY
ncbi:MAG: phosphoenolpyruvate--protein phosphotransferase, partial [Candidatus Kapaibacterium sp.]